MIEITPVFYQIIALITLLLIYCYFYIQDRQLHMGLWALSWFLYLITLIMLFNNKVYEMPKATFIIYVLIICLSHLIMLIATSMFVKVALNKIWYFGSLAIFGLTVILNFLDMPFVVQAFPAFFYIGCSNCKNGLLFIRNIDNKGLGKYITGIAFIIIGVHLVDVPFLITVDWFVPWGYAIQGLLRYLVLIGILVLYLEKTRDELVKKNHYYHLLANNASDVIYRFKTSPNCGFDYISPSITKLTGYLPDDFHNSKKLAYSLIYPNDRHLVKIFIKESALNEYLITFRLIRKDQSIIWVEQKSVPFFNSEGKFVGIDCIVSDITERRNLEQDISRLDRLNLIGQLAASFAHEIRNPMTTVRGYLQYFSGKKDFINYKEHFNLMIEELDRTNAIIKEYLSLSQNRPIDLKLINLNTIINSLHLLLKANANAICVDIQLQLSKIPELYLDEKEIRQLILNLTGNALDAMGDNGGILKISSYIEGDNVVLAIQDDGPGISEDILENIGRPFLTTKDTGTGLGLAVCYRIANRHRAEIKVTSSSAGTTFMVCFKHTKMLCQQSNSVK